MGMSRIEINIKRLLTKCESMAEEDGDTNWRLEKFVSTAESMIQELQNCENLAGKDAISSYTKRIQFLKGLLETNRIKHETNTIHMYNNNNMDIILNGGVASTSTSKAATLCAPLPVNPVEKAVAAQLLGSTLSENISKEIHKKKTTQYNTQLRQQLMADDKGVRQRHASRSGEDLDVLLKYHHSVQEKIADDMLTLARNMKEQSKLANIIIKKDTETVEKSSALAETNFSRLRVESDRLQEHSRKVWKCWLWVMLVVVLAIFICMVLFMRVIKKRV